MSKTSRIVAALIGCLLVTPAASLAVEGPEVRRLFPRQADVHIDRGGLSRLVLPAEVLTVCRPDLSDLRLFDREDRQVAFLIDRGTEPHSELEISRRHRARVLDVERTRVRAEDRSRPWKETIDLEIPDAEPQGHSWVLVLEDARSEFVARVEVVGLDDEDREQPLVQASSLFRLQGSRPVEKLRLPLPPFVGKKIRVTLVTEQGGWLNASFRFESARSLERGRRISVPLEARSVRHRNGQTIVELVRPSGVVPDLLRIGTTTGTFDRRVRVWDEGAGSFAGPLGTKNVFRVDAAVAVGDLELELRPARGESLRVEIENGDSPPLETLSFAAEIRQPSLVFSLPVAEASGPAGVLRFGGGRAHRPRYDLAGLLPEGRRTATGTRAEAAAMLFDPAGIGIARLDPGGLNPLYDRTPALAFAMRAGAEIDQARFEHRRHLRVANAPEGLSRLRLAPSDLALLNADLSDLRISDSKSQQWPYLIEPDAVTELVPFRVVALESTESVSRYELIPPVAWLNAHRLVLDPGVPYFDRPFRVVGRLEGGESRTLASGRLVRPVGDPRPLGLDLSAARVESLELFIEDGDDAPLSLDTAQGAVRLPELFLTAPEGDYLLLLGAPDETAPRYELERVRDVVLAVKAVSIEAQALQENPAFSIASRLTGSGFGQRALLWSVLVLAVLILAALTLRVARRESGN